MKDVSCDSPGGVQGAFRGQSRLPEGNTGDWLPMASAGAVIGGARQGRSGDVVEVPLKRFQLDRQEKARTDRQAGRQTQADTDTRVDGAHRDSNRS